MAQDAFRLLQGELVQTQVRLVRPGRWINRAEDGPGSPQEGARDGPGWSQDALGEARAGTDASRVARALDQTCPTWSRVTPGQGSG